MPFYAGNTHCHTTNSDGDSSPAHVAHCYQNAGFDFVSITDHNHITDPSECAVSNPDFLVIPGSEFTSGLSDPEFRSIHVNGIGVREIFKLDDAYPSISDGLQHAVEQVHKQGAFSTLNHPNWLWSFGAEEMKAVENVDAFEVWNGGWTCNSAGDSEHASTDSMWDDMLSSGKRIWGIASDDCHVFDQAKRDDPFHDKIASAWIEVQADELTETAILAALKSGNFIATSRIKLESLINTPELIQLEIKEWEKVTFETHFIGKNGKILDIQKGRSVSYTPKGDEMYVRAKVYSSTTHYLWTQPVFV
ncbi:MAG: PHP domain-containing protein [Planctomycetes bacterium]|nr:PHP domain-containing protein [Planctomycetota bacterium]